MVTDWLEQLGHGSWLVKQSPCKAVCPSSESYSVGSLSKTFTHKWSVPVMDKYLFGHEIVVCNKVDEEK